MTANTTRPPADRPPANRPPANRPTSKRSWLEQPWVTLLARPWIGTIVRLVLGVVWIYAAWSKLRSPRDFLLAVRAYQATPDWMSRGIAFGLPVLELALGVLLVLGVVVRLAATVSAVLFLVFLIGLVQAAVRGLQLQCGCFGGGGQSVDTSYTLDILRDIGLLILAAYLVVWSYTRFSIDEAVQRGDYVEPPSAKRMRSTDGRRKYEAEVARRSEVARSRDRWIAASAAGVVVLVTLIGIGVQSGRSTVAGSLTAKNASVANGVVYGKAAAATIDVYEDFQCPNCENFEKAAHTALDAAVQANRAQLRFHLMAFLDDSSNGNRYSSRAANAALCASDISADAFVAYHNVLYGSVKGQQVQPEEGTSGRSDSELETYAQAAGITGAKLTTFTSCVQSEQHKALVAAMTDHASADGVTGTPTVKVNGKSVTASLAAVTKAIAAADAKGPKPVPSVTPSLKPSASAASGSGAASSTAAPSTASPSTAPSSVAPSASAASSTVK